MKGRMRTMNPKSICASTCRAGPKESPQEVVKSVPESRDFVIRVSNEAFFFGGGGSHPRGRSQFARIVGLEAAGLEHRHVF